MKIDRRYILPGILLLLALGSGLFSVSRAGKQETTLVSATGELSCSNAQYQEYVKNMAMAGEMTIGRIPPSGTLSQQQKLLDAFEALPLPEDRTLIAVGHYPTGTIYAKECKEERCTLPEMAEPEHACLTEHWDNCPYVAMQFRARKYCFLEPANP
ncbi:hypothetical protein [Ochrobactrum sp. Marseille-Q0166]|uniref:hypothetical protein n=1 Tax=Ochrobactrum sp. Marseille-Q0166 TaxID=2761105 RepID=UPI00165663D2|nr:hypothetical protein [Ochrobactrum sp. Marseille-Q0166]MBC8719938.1 hypothetical protein [Ochrobactrum sp. Marseille-Q0166]